jgi:hypothetical protein
MRKLIVMAVVLLGFVYTSNAQDTSNNMTDSQNKEVKKTSDAKDAKAEATLVKEADNATKEVKEKATLTEDEIKARKEDANIRKDKE